ncbi:MAG: urease accessory protein UreD [Zoogloeaceae bacterium]|jgi:urease accessory protein|nr:urease accessory protein UreD [Zoogloeaceae bacterium]
MMTSAWQARLELEFARRGARSLLTHRRHCGPLVVQKTLHPEGEEICHAIIVHPPGGIAGGDKLEMQIDVGNDARALLTTPGATKWYRSQGAQSDQTLKARVAENAVLEWLPQENIIFNAAEATLATQMRLAAGARVIGWEIVCLGRAASGERFIQGTLIQQMDLFLDDRLIWREHGRLSGDNPLLQSQAGLGGQVVYGTMWLAGGQAEDGAEPARRNLLDTLRGIDFCAGDSAVTPLPHVVIIRALAPSSETLRAHFIRLWQAARLQFLGREAMTPRIWTT